MTEKQIIAWIKCALLLSSHYEFPRQLGPALLWLKAQEGKASPKEKAND